MATFSSLSASEFSNLVNRLKTVMTAHAGVRAYDNPSNATVLNNNASQIENIKPSLNDIADSATEYQGHNLNGLKTGAKAVYDYSTYGDTHDVSSVYTNMQTVSKNTLIARSGYTLADDAITTLESQTPPPCHNYHTNHNSNFHTATEGHFSSHNSAANHNSSWNGNHHTFWNQFHFTTSSGHYTTSDSHFFSHNSAANHNSSWNGNHHSSGHFSNHNSNFHTSSESHFSPHNSASSHNGSWNSSHHSSGHFSSHNSSFHTSWHANTSQHYSVHNSSWHTTSTSFFSTDFSFHNASSAGYHSQSGSCYLFSTFGSLCCFYR